MKKIAFFLCVCVSVFAFASSKDGARFMRELKIVSGDKSCEKVLKKHALNCSGKTYKNDSQKVKKCEIWENERESCILRNIEKKGKI